MSVIYCSPCDLMVDTDFDVDHCYGEDCSGCPCDPEHWYMWYTPQEARELRVDEGLPPISDREWISLLRRDEDDIITKEANAKKE